MECPPSSFKSVKARQDANRKFGVLGAIVGSMLFGALGFMFMGLFGAVLGILLSIAGSFYSVKKRFVEIDLISGESVTLECSSAEVDQILRL